MTWVKSVTWRLIVAIAWSSLAFGCGGDLGPCDEALLGMPQGPYAGQQLLHSTCAGGRCHGQDAVGAARVGAPAGLNFDVVAASMLDEAKVAKGTATVHDWRAEIWDQIGEGDMPPEGNVKFTADQKETVRNWLACGAPVQNQAPNPTMEMTWATIYQGLGDCLACHNAQNPAAGQGFGLGLPGDPCSALDNLINQPAVTPACQGSGMLVVPGYPDQSLLLNKLEQETPVCGGRMPAVGMLDPSVISALRTWVAAGAQTNCP